MSGMDPSKLDNWITGNYGDAGAEPDPPECEHCCEPMAYEDAPTDPNEVCLCAKCAEADNDDDPEDLVA